MIKIDWKFWALFGVAVLTIVVPYLWPQSPPPPPPKKSLSYGVVSVTPLGPANVSGFQSLRIFYGDAPIENPFLVSVLIVNNGEIEIKPDDFTTPITVLLQVGDKLIFPAVAGYSWKEGDFTNVKNPIFAPVIQARRLIDARVASVTPPDLQAKLTKGADRVMIERLLLNPGDQIGIEMLVAGGAPTAVVQARIAGVIQLEEVKQQPPAVKRRPVWPLLILASFLTIGSISLLALRSLPTDLPISVRLAFPVAQASAPVGGFFMLGQALNDMGIALKESPWLGWTIVASYFVLIFGSAYYFRLKPK